MLRNHYITSAHLVRYAKFARTGILVGHGKTDNPSQRHLEKDSCEGYKGTASISDRSPAQLIMVLMLSNSRSAVLLALVTCVVGRFSPSSGVDATAASPDIIPDKYIFEASDSSALRQFGDGGSQASCQRRIIDSH